MKKLKKIGAILLHCYAILKTIILIASVVANLLNPSNIDEHLNQGQFIYVLSIEIVSLEIS